MVGGWPTPNPMIFPYCFTAMDWNLPSITLFPSLNLRRRMKEKKTRKETQRAVCLGEFEEGQWLKHLPNCTHAFHVPCIDTWFQSHSNCPLCRSHVYDVDIHHESSVSMHTMLETLGREDF
ncbi:hypothetical protein CIPAW_13G099800, partial [Carya illinoinensis]